MAARARELKRRSIFVMYVYERECYNNPSFERFQTLPREFQRDILNRQQVRDAQRRLPAKTRTHR